MFKNNLHLLDCTLRDGGYVNEWKWGFQIAQNIISLLVKAGVDVVEVGFLRNVAYYDPDCTVCNTIEDLNNLIPNDKGHTMFSAMAMCSNYDVNKLSPYNGSGIEMIRITAHDYDLLKGLDFAQQIKEKGYKISINPINIMGYSDEEILFILKKINEIQPYQFSIVDTFGSMKRRDLDRIVSLVDNNLDKNIRVALHLHENMALSTCLVQNFIDKHLNRPIAVDASLMGMGRIPGNLPIELVSDYLNDYMDCNYDIDFMMDAIQDYIAPIKGNTKWGYMPVYFLSAKFNLHRNYAEFYLKKGDLTCRDINHILARFDVRKKSVFDEEYANKLYEEYMENNIDDSQDRAKLKVLLAEKIIIIAPGNSINTYRGKILDIINHNHLTVISVNFIPIGIPVDFAFYSNRKRYQQIEKKNCRLIITSNLAVEKCDYKINYNSLTGAFDQGCNSLIMLLKLLKNIGKSEVLLAGADGYVINGDNYYTTEIHSYSEHGNKFNLAVADAMEKLGMDITFVTPSAYQRNK